MNTNDLGRQHNKAPNSILASKCQLTDVFVDERQQITSLYRFPQNPERLAVWEEKLSAVKILYSHAWQRAVLLHVCAIFRLENTQ